MIIKVKNEELAKRISIEQKLPYTFCVFNGEYYVGDRKDIRHLGTKCFYPFGDNKPEENK